MFRLDDELKVSVHRDAVDFRKSMNGLAAIVEQSMKLDPFARAVYVFSNQRRDRIKMLLWDRTCAPRRASVCTTTSTSSMTNSGCATSGSRPGHRSACSFTAMATALWPVR